VSPRGLALKPRAPELAALKANPAAWGEPHEKTRGAVRRAEKLALVKRLVGEEQVSLAVAVRLKRVAIVAATRSPPSFKLHQSLPPTIPSRCPPATKLTVRIGQPCC
jgi:hypothetical protein